ncbi:MAG TPA: isoprenylcysteine carboxylmethyltransferase family protein [Kribbella sp.]|nr:isoprenylcysteine carboxylmethyltransferase family protein [Kribbella sp.]
MLVGEPPGSGQELVADAILIVGTVWSIWSLRSLGKNLSVVAQARDVVQHGPYRWVRHPLYTGELVSSLGVVIAAGSPAAGGVWLLLVALQVYRALREEHVLLRTLPEYADYRTRTAALLPGVF